MVLNFMNKIAQNKVHTMGPSRKRIQLQIFLVSHYENLPMQYTEIFLALKIEHFQLKKNDIFLIFAQNIDCGYTLEPPRRGGSNEYPQSVLEQKEK